MKVYPSASLNTMPAGQEAAGGLLGGAPVIAVRLADLVLPASRAPAGGDRTALVVADTPVIGTGDLPTVITGSQGHGVADPGPLARHTGAQRTSVRPARGGPPGRAGRRERRWASRH